MKLFQKILSHGLLIGFFVAAFFLYLYRVELFPQWFGTEMQPVAARSGSGTVGGDQDPETVTPPAQIEPVTGSTGGRIAADAGAVAPATEEAPPPAGGSGAQPQSAPAAEPGGEAPTELPPVVGAGTEAEEPAQADAVAPTGRPPAAGTSDDGTALRQPGLAAAPEPSSPAGTVEEQEPQPASVAEPEVPPLTGTPDEPEAEGAEAPAVAPELPPLADTGDEQEGPADAAAAGAPELPPLTGAEEAEVEAQRAAAGAPEVTPLASAADEAPTETQPEPEAARALPPLVETAEETGTETQPESPATTEPPSPAGAADQSAAQAPQGAPASAEMPPAADIPARAAQVGEAETDESAEAPAAAGVSEGGGDAVAATPETAESSGTEPPTYRDVPTREPAVTWQPPEEPLSPEYGPLHQPRRSEASWPAPSEQTGTGAQATPGTATQERQYRPEKPRRRAAPVPGRAPAWTGTSPAAVPGATPGGSNYERLLAEARRHFWQQDLVGAVVAYEKLTRGYPDRADAWGEFGNVNFRLGNWSAAADAYYTAIGLLADQGEDARARQLLKVLYGLDAEKAGELEERLR